MSGVRPWPKPNRLPLDQYNDPARVFHLVLRAFPGTAPFNQQSGDLTWQILMNELERPAIELYAAALLTDHLHVLVSPGAKSIPGWVNSFKGQVSRTLAVQSLWQPSYFDRVIRGVNEFRQTVSYIVQNPEAAGLGTPGDWPWVYVSERAT